jgi:hypothetical protein
MVRGERRRERVVLGKDVKGRIGARRGASRGKRGRTGRRNIG